jgi:hypothetical protein
MSSNCKTPRAVGVYDISPFEDPFDFISVIRDRSLHTNVVENSPCDLTQHERETLKMIKLNWIVNKVSEETADTIDLHSLELPVGGGDDSDDEDKPCVNNRIELLIHS